MAQGRSASQLRGLASSSRGRWQGAFRECTGLGSENEVVEYKASGPKGEFVIKKVPGRMKWNNITLKRGITDAMDMWKWRKLVEDGQDRRRPQERLDRHVRPGPAKRSRAGIS